jgi:hypothetical protein
LHRSWIGDLAERGAFVAIEGEEHPSVLGS